MSTTIDNKIVEMSFNNSDFEKNAQQTIDTTEKLKKSLDFDGAGKGLEQLGAAAKNCNVGVLATAAETVSEKFDYMKYIAIYALQDIYNMATRTAAQLVNTFAIQPVTSGFQEYELKMGSIQTIMASTGASLDAVNGYLDELNLYADKTIYSFADMTNNIGKFTNAGVDLDKAVAAIQGISNEAAVSGANTNEASRAMYNFAQALSAGYVKLIDWKSIENANMATVEFKQQLIDTAVELGNLEKQADGTYKVLTQSTTGSSMDNTISATQNFNDSLQYQWMTTDVLVNTLHDYADETTAIGKKAFAAATEVKTFSMMMDTLTEAAGSGWTETWEIVIGDFEQAKKFWTKLTDYFDDIIGGMSDARNTLLKESLSAGFDLIEDKVDAAGLKTEDFEKKIIELGNNSGLTMDQIIEDAGSLGEAFESGAISTDLITQAINELASSANLSEEKTKALSSAASDMFDNLHAKSGRTLLQESLYNTLDSIKMIIETINNTWSKLDDTFTSSKIYSVIEKVNKATSDFKQYISDNLADPWYDVEAAITESGMTMDEFQSKLADTARASDIDLDSLIDQYGSLQGCFEAGVITGDLVIDMFDEMNTTTTTTTKTVTKTISNLEDVLSKYQTVVDQVWNGDWKNAPERYQLLADAGWDYQKVQALVNRTVDQHRITLEDLNAVGIQTTETTTEQIEVINELAQAATESGTSINEALNKLGRKTGLQIAVEAVHDVFKALKVTAVSVKDAIVESFDSSIISTFAKRAYSAISWIQGKTSAFSSYITSRTEQIKRTVSGVFKIFQSLAKDAMSVVSGLIKIAAKLFDSLDGALPDVLDMTAAAGDLFSAIADGLDISEEIDKFFDGVVDKLPNVVQIVKDFINTLKDLPIVGDIIRGGEDIWGWISGSIGDQVSKIQSGEVDIHDAIVHVGETVVNAISEMVAYIKKNGFAGIQKGLSEGRIAVLGEMSEFATGMSGPIASISDSTKNFLDRLGKAALAIAPIVGAFSVLSGVVKSIKTYSQTLMKAFQPLAAISDVVGNFAGLIKQTTTSLKSLGDAASFAIKTEAFINLAIAVGIIAGVIVVLAKIMHDDPESAWTAVQIVAAIVIGLSYVAVQLGQIKLGDTKSLMAISAFALGISVFVGVLAICVVQLGKLSVSELAKGLIAVTAIVGLLAALVYVMQKTVNKNKFSKNAAETYKSLGAQMIKIAAALLIVGIAVKLIATVDNAGWAKALTVMTVFYGFMIGMIGAFALIAKDAKAVASVAKLMETLGTSMLEIGAAFALVAVGIKLIGGMSQGELNRAISTLYSLMAFLAVMILVAAVAQRVAGGAQTQVLAANLLGVVAAIGIMAIIAVLLGKCDPAQLAKGMAFIVAFEALAIGLYAAVAAINKYLGGGKSTKFMAAMLAISASIAIMAAVAVLLGYCDPAKTQMGIIFVGELVVLASLMALAASSMKEEVLSKMTAMAACVAVLAICAVALSILDPAQIQVGVAAMSILMGMFSLMMASASLLGKTDKLMGKIVAMAAIVAAFAGIIFLLCTFGQNMDQALSVSAGLGTLMLSMAAAMAIVSNCRANADISKSTIVAMVGVATAASLLLMVLTRVIGEKANAAIPIAGAVSAVILALSAAMVIISNCKSDTKISGSVLGAMIEVAVLAGALLGVLVTVIGDNAVAALPIAGALAIIMPVLAACGVGLSQFGDKPIATSTIVSLTVLAGCMALIGVVIAEMVKSIGNRVTQARPIAIALGELIIVLTACAVALSNFGIKPISTSVIVSLVALAGIMDVLGIVITNMVNAIANNADAAIQAAASLSIILLAIAGAAVILQTIQAFNFAAAAEACVVAIGVLALIVAGIIALATIIEQNGGKVETAMQNLVTIATALGQAIGGFVGGLLSSLLTPFVALIDDLGNAFTKLSFALSVLSAKDVANAAILVAVFSALAGANFPSLLINQIVEAFAGESPIEAGLRSLGEGIAAFANACSGVDVTNLPIIAACIAPIANALSQASAATGGSGFGSLVTALTGGNVGMEVGMKQLGEGLAAFATATASVDVSNLAEKAQGIAYLAEALNSLNGVTISEMLTDTSAAGFNGACRTLASGVAEFSVACSLVSVEAVNNGAEALKTILTALSSVPNTGGILQDIFGEQDYSKFGQNLTDLGAGIADFSRALTAEGFSFDAVNQGADALGNILNALSNLPNTGGLLQDVLGGQNYDSFGTSLEGLGKGLAKFMTESSGVSVESISPATDAMSYILKALENLPTDGGLIGAIFGTDSIGLDDFTTQLPSLGAAIKSYADNVSGGDYNAASVATSAIGTILTKISQVQSSGVSKDDAIALKGIVNELKGTDTAGLADTFSEEKINAIGIDKFVYRLQTALSTQIQNADFHTVMSTLVNKIYGALSTSMNTSSDTTGSLGSNLVTSISNSITSSLVTFNTVGNQVATEFKNGFNVGISSVNDMLAITLNNVSSYLSLQNTAFYSFGTELMTQMGNGIKAGSATVGSTITSAIVSVCSSAASSTSVMQTAGATAMSNYATGISNSIGVPSSAASTVTNAAVSVMRNMVGLFVSPGYQSAAKFAEGMRSGLDTIRSAAQSMANAASSDLNSDAYYEYGGYAAEGFANGLRDSSYKVVIAAKAMAIEAANAAKKALGIESPSRVFMSLGDFSGQGLAVGMLNTRKLVEKSAAGLAAASVDGFNSASGGLLDMNSSIVPTIDYSSIKANTSKLDFSATMNRLISNPVKSSAELMAETQAKFDASNQRLADGLTALQADLATYSDAIANSETAMYVDGKKLASSIVKPMNQQLGILAKRNG